MISSRNTLASLEQAIRGVRRDEDNLASDLRQAADDLASARSRQSELFRDLARLRLDAIRQGEVLGPLDTAEETALRAKEQWQQRVHAAASARAELQQQIAAAEDDRLEKVDAVEAAVDASDDLKAAAQGDIEANSDWKAQRKALMAAEAVAKAALGKAVTAEADLDNKGKPYKADPLFMYLWNAGYGTDRYQGGALARFFDKRIARLIGYGDARRDYAMLTEIPKRLHAHARHVTEKAEAEDTALEAIERKLLEARGLGELEQELEEAHTVLTEAEAGLNTLHAALKERDAENESLRDPERDDTYREAVAGLARALEREDIDRLWHEAKQTRTTEDESLVGRIQENLDRLRDLDRHVAQTRQGIADLASKRAELERSRDHFYRSGYDNPIGGFSNGEAIGEVIGGILAGAIKNGQLGDVFDRGYRRQRRPDRGSLGGGIRFPSGPPRGPWTGGGSFGRPGPSRPGGFRTTGGF